MDSSAILNKTFDYAAFSEFGFYNVLIQIFKLLTNQDIDYWVCIYGIQSEFQWPGLKVGL